MFQPIRAHPLQLLHLKPWHPLPPIYQKSLSRFASTNSSFTVSTPTDSSSSAFSQTPVPTDTFNEVAFDSLSSTDLLPVTEHIGYLKELGINFGWGITTSVQWLLEHVHIYSGGPWWASIALTAVIVRLAIFPLYVKAMDTSGRLSVIQPQMAPIQQRVNASRAAQDNAAAVAAMGEIRSLFRTNQIKFRNMFWPMLIQFPVGFCTFRLLRSMAELPVPGLESQGLLWIQDLTVGDPYAIMPLALGTIMYVTFKVFPHTQL